MRKLIFTKDIKYLSKYPLNELELRREFIISDINRINNAIERNKRFLEIHNINLKNINIALENKRRHN